MFEKFGVPLNGTYTLKIVIGTLLNEEFLWNAVRMSLTSHSQTESSHSNGKLNKKASDFSEAFVLVAGTGLEPVSAAADMTSTSC